MVVQEDSLQEDDLRLLGGDAGLQLAEDAEVVELQLRADLEGEGRLGEVPAHTVHGDQHGTRPGGPCGQGASAHGLAGAGLLDGSACVSVQSPLREAPPRTTGLSASVPAAWPPGTRR